MKLPFRHVLIVGLLMLAAFSAGAWASTQGAPRATLPVVLSGADFGFRVTAQNGETPIGEVVVRMNGEWKPVQFKFGLRPLTKQER